MKELINQLNKLMASDISKVINQRVNEFKQVKDEFSELCFCILTANYNAERSIKIQEAVGKGFCELSEDELIGKLRELGHRFPNTRAKYILEARNHKNSLELNRDWLVNNIVGLGMKESSHFLRNIGFTDVAIIDFHIIDLLVRYRLIERPKTLNKRKYLEIEEVLRSISKEAGLNLAELDLYLWYLETGKVLK